MDPCQCRGQLDCCDMTIYNDLSVFVRDDSFSSGVDRKMEPTIDFPENEFAVLRVVVVA